MSVVPFTQGDLRDYGFDNGTRLFAEFSGSTDVASLKKHARNLRGVTIITTPQVESGNDSILSFSFRGRDFFVTSSQGDFLFFVADVDAPDSVLMTVAVHFNKLLGHVSGRYARYDQQRIRRNA